MIVGDEPTQGDLLMEHLICIITRECVTFLRLLFNVPDHVSAGPLIFSKQKQKRAAVCTTVCNCMYGFFSRHKVDGAQRISSCTIKFWRCA